MSNPLVTKVDLPLTVQEQFFAELEARGKPKTTWKELGLPLSLLKQGLKTDPEFAERYEDALSIFHERIEEEIMLQAFGQEALRDPETGKICGYRRIPGSKRDTRALLAFASRHIDAYKPGRTEVKVSTGVIVVPAQASSADEWVAQHAVVQEVTVEEDSKP